MNKKMIYLIVGLVFNFLSLSTAKAADHFVRQGAIGSGNGNDWTNAHPSLPATLIRGDTYYVARGSYPGRTFNTPASGALPIIIKGATAADHGGAVPGWSNSYSVSAADGGSQAIWTSAIALTTSYWVFDGSVGPTWSKTPTDYGFTFNSSMTQPITVGTANGTNITDLKIAHIAATAPSGDVQKVFVITNYSSGQTNNVTISHCYLNGWQNAYMATTAARGYQENWIFEYSVSLNGFSSAANHGEDINNNSGLMNNQITRYSWFEGRTSGTGVIVANNNNNINAKIYGNVFKNMSGGNGIITGTSAGRLVSPIVYNNTFINCQGGGWIGGNTTGTPLVYNNLIYDMSGIRQTSSDYNAYFSVTGAPNEQHGIIESGSPFINELANDLRLQAPIAAGIPLLAPYNVDAFGNSVAATRGAAQYPPPSGSIPPAPTPVLLAPPSKLRIL